MIQRFPSLLRRQAGRCIQGLLAIFFTMGILMAEVPTATAEKTNDLTELSLERLMEIEVPTVVGASKFAQKTTAAPASVTIITAEEVKKYGYRTLADILQSVQGFYISNDRNYSFIGSRGINLGDFNSRVLLLVNGHRVNNNLTDGAFVGSEFILDVDLIDHVEIIRGPSSVLYGNNAFFGVINVITRDAAGINGVEASAEYGTFDFHKVRVSYGKAFTNGVHFLLSGTYGANDGAGKLFYKEFNIPAQNNGIAAGRDDEVLGNFFGSLGFEDFTLEGAFIRREKGNPTAQYFTTFNDPALRTIDDRSYVEFKYAHSFPGIVDVKARTYYDQNNFEIGYPVAGALFIEKQAGEWWGTEVQLDKHVWEKHILSAGAEFRDDFHQTRVVYDAAGGLPFTDVHRSRQNFGTFLQGDFELHQKLHTTIGGRFDQYGDFDPTISPRAALIYDPFAKTTLKAIYGTAFRDPNFLELSDTRFQNINPEKITSFELVYEQGLGDNLRSSVSGFYNQIDDLITLQSGSFTNIDATAKGVEAALEGVWAKGVRGRASYSFQETGNSSGMAFPDSPRHLVKFNVSVPVYREKVFAGLEFQYTSARDTVFTTTTGDTVPGSEARGFSVVNFTLFSQNLVKNLEMSASIYNLLDTDYSDPSTRFHQQDAIPQNGRTFRLKATYRF